MVMLLSMVQVGPEASVVLTSTAQTFRIFSVIFSAISSAADAAAAGATVP